MGDGRVKMAGWRIIAVTQVRDDSIFKECGGDGDGEK